MNPIKFEPELEYTRETTLGELLDRGGGHQPGTSDALTLHFSNAEGEFVGSFCIVRGVDADIVTDAVFTALVGGPIPKNRVLH
jgi:hypothetical protein